MPVPRPAVPRRHVASTLLGKTSAAAVFYIHDHFAMADAFADQLVELRPRLVAFARSLAFDPDEAEDLAQEALVRAVAARDRYRTDSNLRAWLFTILRNVHLNRRRQLRRWPDTLELHGVDRCLAQPSVEAEVVTRSEVAAILEAMRRLPPEFAAPLHLLAVEDLSYAEIARVLEIPIGTVMSRIFRGRRLMATWLGGA